LTRNTARTVFALGDVFGWKPMRRRLSVVPFIEMSGDYARRCSLREAIAITMSKRKLGTSVATALHPSGGAAGAVA